MDFPQLSVLVRLKKDYLKNGFFAMNSSEELPCKGPTVTFIKKIEDVTAKVMSNVKAEGSEKQKDSNRRRQY